MYSMPYSKSSEVMIFNKTIFEANGIFVPTDRPLTWAELDVYADIVVGDGPNRIKLTQMVKHLELDANVIFTGYRPDVDQLYHIFSVSVMLTNTSVHLEGISNVILESMAVGVPVIATKAGGTMEIIEDKFNGILVSEKSPQKVAEAIVALLSNPQKAEELSIRARQSVREKFDLQRYVKEYESIYHELIPNWPHD